MGLGKALVGLPGLGWGEVEGQAHGVPRQQRAVGGAAVSEGAVAEMVPSLQLSQLRPLEGEETLSLCSLPCLLI